MESFAVKLLIALLILMVAEFFIYRLLVFKNLNYSRELSKNAVFEGEEVFLYEKIEVVCENASCAVAQRGGRGSPKRACRALGVHGRHPMSSSDFRSAEGIVGVNE